LKIGTGGGSGIELCRQTFPHPSPRPAPPRSYGSRARRWAAVILTVAIVLLWLGLVHIALAVARAGMRIGAKRASL
jgi:hypothetical protein